MICIMYFFSMEFQQHEQIQMGWEEEKMEERTVIKEDIWKNKFLLPQGLPSGFPNNLSFGRPNTGIPTIPIQITKDQ